MQASTLWWILTGLTLAAELTTGVIYLLMLALGLAAGAVAAHLGLDWNMQIYTAATVGAACTFTAYRIRRQRTPAQPASANADVNLDIGETLHIPAWDNDHTARITYRGSLWTAVPQQADTTPPSPGTHRIVDLQGNRLVVTPARHP